ncbi:hypothetical protein ACLOJK_031970 [Asimina triloba]
MAAAASQLFLRILPSTVPCGNSTRLFLGPTTTTTARPTSLLLSHVTQSRPAVAFARRRKGNSSSSTKPPSSNQKVKEKFPKKLKQIDDEEEEDDDLDEDAFEALFSQLEKDLKNDNMSDDDDDDDDDDEISEEDLAMLEKELEDAFSDGSDEEQSEASQSDADVAYDDDEEEEEEEPPVKLRTWQLRRLASALKIGRRKTSIKSLAGELGLDRAVVLELLREPPPDLLLMCASLPDKVITTPVEPTSPLVEKPESKPAEYSSAAADAKEQKPAVKAPVHVMYNKWSSQKRIKKIQLETLERIYSRTKRPTNAMISSIVHVTNLPWKRVVKWFEEKRIEDGVPDKRLPYSRPEPETLPRT